MQFWRSRQFFLTKSWKFFAQWPKVGTKSQKTFSWCLKIEKICFSVKQKNIYFPSDWLYGQVECNFKNPVKNFGRKAGKFLLNVMKLFKIPFFKNSFNQKNPTDELMMVWQPQRNLFDKRHKNFSSSLKKMRVLISSRKELFFIKIFLGPSKIQLR